MYAAATKSAIDQMREQESSIKRLAPVYEDIQFNTVNRLAKGLDNQYLGTLRNAVASQLAESQNELALGRSLTPEQERNAQQSARAAFAARGMAGSNAASAAEILNRDAAGERRLNERRQRMLGLAGGYAELDPFSRAINPAFQVGTANTGTASNLIGSTFANSMNTAGNVESFNRNLQGSMYNTWQNNNAAIQAANLTGRASQSAGMMGMFGGIAQGLGSAAGGYFSDRRMKKDIKQVGKDGVLGLKTYEYRFKGESKDAPKHIGYMAQEVKRVLPKAVEEVTVNGKKRLTIKPMVIGQALAAEIAAQQDAMFADGYTVGAGFAA
jgi:hypothetical protein